ncbi:MAG: AraC family transcriptional regulator, partial [Myxococcota bacterium]
MDLADLRARVEQVAVHSRGAYGGTRLSAVPGLSVYRSDVRTDFEASVYSPVVCLILQGRKETTIGGRHFEVGPGSCIIVSHDLPVEARVLEARPSAPFLSIVVGLDLEEMRSLEEEVEDAAAPPDPEAYAVGEADPILLGVLGRYLDLAQDEEGV